MHAPLHGIRIIDLSAVVSGPMATGILADQGADVIKIEPPKGDLTRVIGPAQGDISALFASINRGKRSLVLDLKHPEGKAILRELLAGADALVENFRPGALDRLGFSFEVLQQINPRLVCLSIAGFGHSGPMAGYRVYDPVVQAVAGFADAHPDPETGEPRLLQTLMCDKITALTAAQAIGEAGGVGDRGGPDVELEPEMGEDVDDCARRFPVRSKGRVVCAGTAICGGSGSGWWPRARIITMTSAMRSRPSWACAGSRWTP